MSYSHSRPQAGGVCPPPSTSPWKPWVLISSWQVRQIRAWRTVREALRAKQGSEEHHFYLHSIVQNPVTAFSETQRGLGNVDPSQAASTLQSGGRSSNRWSIALNLASCWPPNLAPLLKQHHCLGQYLGFVFSCRETSSLARERGAGMGLLAGRRVHGIL